jgi:AraC-like DNA-binding protein
MLTAEQINTIHRLHFAERWSIRKIARHLHIGRRTIAQYLATSPRTPARRKRASKLDPFKATIAELLDQDAEASAVLIAQKLRSLGFDGGLSILKEYLQRVRMNTQAKPMCAWSRQPASASKSTGAVSGCFPTRERAQALCFLFGGVSQSQALRGVHS